MLGHHIRINGASQAIIILQPWTVTYYNLFQSLSHSAIAIRLDALEAFKRSGCSPLPIEVARHVLFPVIAEEDRLLLYYPARYVLDEVADYLMPPVR